MDEEKRVITIAVAIAMAMVLLFIGTISYIKIHKKNAAVNELGADEQADEEAEIDLEQVDYKAVDVSDLIVTVNDVDVNIDDTAINEIDEEDLYINTTELLPSVYKQRELVNKEKIDTSNFPDSYALTSENTINIDGVKVSVPKEVYLYNSGISKSSEYTLKVAIEGDADNIVSYGWASSDASKVSVLDQEGTSTTVSVVDTEYEGTVLISLFITYEPKKGQKNIEELDFNVVVEGISYGDDQLSDKKGNSLYLDKNGKNEAHVSDYSSYDYFYGEIKTTGWQNIDGKTYYFNSDSWAVTGRQIIGGLPYDFDDNGVLTSDVGQMGIDVSKWQKDIDWSQVAASGIDFAIIRCGFRGSVSGSLVEDPYFRANVEGATANGIAVGVYFFTQAVTEQEAIEEASMAIEMCEGYNITLPIYIDSENAVNGRANDLGKGQRTACLRAFCQTINNSGYTGGVYASKSWFYNKVNAAELEEFNIWVAQYNKECNYTGKTDFWQYSSKEIIAGIEGFVDVDVVRKSYSE